MATLLDLLPRQRGSTRLRRFTAADIAAFARYRADAELARFQGWSPIDLEAARRFVTTMAALPDLQPGQWIQLAIADVDDDALVGDVGVFVDAAMTESEVGFTVAREFQGRRHAANAVRLLVELLAAATPVGLLRATTDVRNLGSIRVLERTGFVATHEYATEFKGEPCTERAYRLPLERASQAVKAAAASDGL